MARLRASWRTSLPASQQPRNPQSESIARTPYDSGPAVLRFTNEAQRLFRAWMEDIQREARSGSLSSSLESHLLKLPKTVAGLALLFELVEGGRVAVGESATMRALAWA